MLVLDHDPEEIEYATHHLGIGMTDSKKEKKKKRRENLLTDSI